jgi:hypothetical protein
VHCFFILPVFSAGFFALKNRRTPCNLRLFPLFRMRTHQEQKAKSGIGGGVCHSRHFDGKGDKASRPRESEGIKSLLQPVWKLSICCGIVQERDLDGSSTCFWKGFEFKA